MTIPEFGIGTDRVPYSSPQPNRHSRFTARYTLREVKMRQTEEVHEGRAAGLGNLPPQIIA
jgi:hypothetical protein